MKILELFCGTKSISKVFEERGHETFTVDFDESLNPDLCIDVIDLTAEMVLEKFGKPDVIWASPDCTSYSIAAISHHRTREGNGNLSPKSDYAKYCDKVNVHTLNLIKELNPRLYFIENPRGVQENGLHPRPSKIHGHLLQVWRYTHEADRYLD